MKFSVNSSKFGCGNCKQTDTLGPKFYYMQVAIPPAYRRHCLLLTLDGKPPDNRHVKASFPMIAHLSMNALVLTIAVYPHPFPC